MFKIQRMGNCIENTIKLVLGFFGVLCLMYWQIFMLTTGNWKQNTALIAVYALGFAFWQYAKSGLHKKH